MTDDEVAAFENKYGYKPTFYRVALDALAIYVNKKNPIRGLTLQQLHTARVTGSIPVPPTIKQRSFRRHG